MLTMSLVAVAGHAQDASKNASDGDRFACVRTSDATIAALIEEATAASATFRRLVDLIHATDGLVYVFSHDCGRLASACLTMSVSAAGPYRILQVLVNTGRDHIDVKASIGHELQHAIEVLGQPDLTTDADLFFFWKRARLTISGAKLRGAVFETDAAIRAGDAVRAELKVAAETSGSTDLLASAEGT